MEATKETQKKLSALTETPQKAPDKKGHWDENPTEINGDILVAPAGGPFPYHCYD